MRVRRYVLARMRDLTAEKEMGKKKILVTESRNKFVYEPLPADDPR